MKESIKIFENAQFGQIRTSVTESGEPLFCLADVCKILGLGNTSQVKARLQQDGVTTITVGVKTGLKADGSDAMQNVSMVFVSEPNLYKCISQSRKKEAEQFQKWVCGTVLPSNRKAGGCIPVSSEDDEKAIFMKNSSMKGQVTVFNSPLFGDIRTSVTESGEPLFCLADVCKALALKASHVKERLAKDVVSTDTLVTAGGKQQLNFVNEDGLYDVILDSRKPQAKAFRKWVTSEVLPSIRKTGGYIPVSSEDDEKAILAKAVGIYERTVQALQNRVAYEETRSKQLAQQSEAQQTALAAQRPIVEYAKDILQSGSSLTLTQVAKALGFRSVYAFTKMLIENRVLYRQGENLIPYANFSGKGLFSFRSYRYVKSDGSVGTCQHLTVTELGKKFIHDNYVSPAMPGKEVRS